MHVSAAVQLLQGCRLHARWAAGRKPRHALLSAGAPVASVHVTLLLDLPPAMTHNGCCQLSSPDLMIKTTIQQAIFMYTADVALYRRARCQCTMRA